MNYKLLFFIFIISSADLLSQEKWMLSRKPEMTGEYTKLPADYYSWQNTNAQTMYYRFENSVITVGPSFRVFPSSPEAQQDEVILVRHPSNHDIMFGSANTTASNVKGMGAYITTDGGISWTGTNLIPTLTTFSSSDPGPTIDKNGVIIFTVLQNPGIVSVTSTNNGQSWTDRVVIQSGSHDKNFASSDDAPTSPFYGRSYVVWSNFSLSNPPIVISHTTNSGAEWSPMRQINTPVPGHYAQGCDIAIGPGGEVYVCWAAPLRVTPFTEDFTGFARSTDGGMNWAVTDYAFNTNGIRGTGYNGWGIRVNSFPRIAVDRSSGPRNGWIYIVASDVDTIPVRSDADVIMHYSSNGGTSWSNGIKVNLDVSRKGKVQFFPAINLDDGGGINIVFYDNRNYLSVGDSCETFMARSTDGGISWINFPVSDHSWKVKPEPGFPGYMGDYIGITSGNNKVWPFWFDDKTGSMQAWTCEIELDILGISQNNNEIPKQFSLKQNYPNPFNPNTQISFSISKAGNVSLEVFDASGKRAAQLINGNMNGGNYKFDFNAKGLSSGVYFYRLTAVGFTETKKMMIVK